MATFTRDLTSSFELDPATDIRNVHGAPGWTELSTPDPEAAQSFLEAALGWSFQVMPMAGGDYLIGAVHDHGVGGVRAPQPGEGGEPQWRTYIAVADAGELVRRVEEAGGRLTMEPFDIPDVGRVVAFEHPAVGQLLAMEYLRPFS
jgi:uncharacterized protein